MFTERLLRTRNWGGVGDNASQNSVVTFIFMLKGILMSHFSIRVPPMEFLSI
jgi:hypothetical protein